VLPQLRRGGGSSGEHLFDVLRRTPRSLRQPWRGGARDPDPGQGPEPDAGWKTVD